MHWQRLIILSVGAGVVSSLTDWLFASDWLHRRWTYPEAWRKGVESRAIALTTPLPFLTCGVFAWLCVRLGLHSLGSACGMAIAVWLIGPLPMLLTNAAFVKLHRVFVAAQAVGWLVKLTLAALAVGWFYH